MDPALAIHQNLVDVTDLLVVGPINVGAHQLRAAHQVGRHLGHDLTRSGGLGGSRRLGYSRTGQQGGCGKACCKLHPQHVFLL
jgi:hypothetical protein